MGILKNKLTLVLILFLILSVLSGGFMFKLYKKEKKERQRTERNQDILLRSEQNKFKFTLNEKDSLYAIEVGELTLSKRELKDNRDSLVNVVKALGVKLNRLESITKTETVVETEFDAPIEDKPVIVNTPEGQTLDTMKCIDWKDDFNSFSACIDGDTLRNAKMTNIVPITQVVDRIPKIEFWFIRLGTKGIRQQMFSDNPNAEIKYAEVINLK